MDGRALQAATGGGAAAILLCPMTRIIRVIVKTRRPTGARINIENGDAEAGNAHDVSVVYTGWPEKVAYALHHHRRHHTFISKIQLRLTVAHNRAFQKSRDQQSWLPMVTVQRVLTVCCLHISTLNLKQAAGEDMC